MDRSNNLSLLLINMNQNKNKHQLNIIFRCHVLTNLFQSVIENYDLYSRDCIVTRNRTVEEKFAMKMSQDFVV